MFDGDCCPDCGSPDIDISTDLSATLECQDCGWLGEPEDLE